MDRVEMCHVWMTSNRTCLPAYNEFEPTILFIQYWIPFHDFTRQYTMLWYLEHIPIAVQRIPI